VAIDLKKRYLEEILEIIQKFIPDCQVSIFGSRVTGRSGKFSDIDLVVKGKDELGLTTMVKIKDAFTESNLPFKVDVLDWLAISSEFRRQINQECVVIYPEEQG